MCQNHVHLRLNDDRLLESGVLPLCTRILRSSLARSLGGGLGDAAWKQATCGSNEGGIGLRTAEEVALPAFVASRTAAKPAVQDIFLRLEAAGLATPGVLAETYDARTDDAVKALQAKFAEGSPENTAVAAVVAEGLQAATDWWQQAAEGDPTADSLNAEPQPADVAMIAGVEVEEGESNRPGPLAIQKKLSALVDASKVSSMRESFVETDMVEDLLRLDDLQDEHQEHSWMWALNPVTEPVLAEKEWLSAVRLRLGAVHVSSEMLCGSCGKRVLDQQAYHALCCAKGECTKGHNKVRDTLHAGFAASDPGAAIEVEGLVPSDPDLRPADVLTTAARPNEVTAVDVGIIAPHAAGAGDNCVETMRTDKMQKYEAVLPELEAQGIKYCPATISCYGRRHPCVTQMLTLAARGAARRRGGRCQNGILRRWCRTIAADVWRRAARMIAACLPPEPDQTQFLLEGEVVDAHGDEDVSAEAAASLVTSAPAAE